jgi:hypothetical protein
MNPYRIYFLNSGNFIAGVYELECPSDEAAVEAAADVIGGYPAAEIWSGTRALGRMTAAECEAYRAARAE